MKGEQCCGWNSAWKYPCLEGTGNGIGVHRGDQEGTAREGCLWEVDNTHVADGIVDAKNYKLL